MTDRQLIIDFLTKHPEWVDAYRTVYPQTWLRLQWNPYRCNPGVWTLHDRQPTNVNAENEMFFVLLPEGEWRPLPEPETFELHMMPYPSTGLRSFGNLVGSYAQAKSTYRALQADARFAGPKVKVTVEAIR